MARTIAFPTVVVYFEHDGRVCRLECHRVSGGETSFPAIGLRVVPRKGGAVFFVNTDSRCVPDAATVHAGCPVLKGVKFVANKWLGQRAW